MNGPRLTENNPKQKQHTRNRGHATEFLYFQTNATNLTDTGASFILY